MNMPFINLARQYEKNKDALDQAVMKVLGHGQYINGPEVAELEMKLAEYVGCRYALTCSSGTDALFLVLLAHGVGPGDAVLVPNFTFCATAEVVSLTGATPVLCDIDPSTWNLDATKLAHAIDLAKSQNLHCRGIIPVDIFGCPADYTRINKFADKHGLWVLADAAQSFGAKAADKFVGTLAHATATSFFPAKPLGCYGDGGAVFTDDEAFIEVLRSLRIHGQGGHKYDNIRVGINGRLDTIQAAVLLEKLAIYPQEWQRRQQIAKLYRDSIEHCQFQHIPNGSQSAWAQFTCVLPSGSRGHVMRGLSEQGIPSAIYYPSLISQQPAYCSCPSTCAPESKTYELLDRVLSLPMHPYLSDEQVIAVSTQINSSLVNFSDDPVIIY